MRTYIPESDEERDYLANYDPSGFPNKATTADIVIFTIKDGKFSLLLVRRGNYPYKNHWALPGGFVNLNENSEEAARREVKEETSINVDDFYLEQLKAYDEPGRDPRMSITSVAYFALLPDLPNPVGGDDAIEAKWFAVDDLFLEEGKILVNGEEEYLAFDHAEIINDALQRVRSKFEYMSIAKEFLPQYFTLGDLRRIYEIVWGYKLHPANFRRKILGTPNLVEPFHGDDSRVVEGPSILGGRSAHLYSIGSVIRLNPPLLRNEDDRMSPA